MARERVNASHIIPAAEALGEVRAIAYGLKPQVPPDEQQILDRFKGIKEISDQQKLEFATHCMEILLDPPIANLFIQYSGYEGRVNIVGASFVGGHSEGVGIRLSNNEDPQLTKIAHGYNSAHNLGSRQERIATFVKNYCTPNNIPAESVTMTVNEEPSWGDPNLKVSVEYYNAQRPCVPEDFIDESTFTELVDSLTNKCKTVKERLVKKAYGEAGVLGFDDEYELERIDALQKANELLRDSQSKRPKSGK